MQQVKIFLLLMLLSCSQSVSRPQQTRLRSAYERAFSRKKRALIFPPGSFIKFTCLFSKGLLSTYPRGLNFNLEEAVYFPIPGSRNDLYPKRFLPKKTTTPKPLTTTPETFVYIPGTDWRFKAQALPKPKPRPNFIPIKTQRIDEGNFANPYKWQKWAKYGNKQAQKWQTSANKQRWQVTKKANWSKWTTPAPKWTADWTNQWRRHRVAKAAAAAVVAPAESRHFHAHRDRRQLFEHFSGLTKLLGFDVKSCILRSICDSKRLLLPKGYSMLQDMLRLVFNMPRIDGLDDEYSRVMRQDADTCAKELRTKCNMNLLIWLLSGRRD